MTDPRQEWQNQLAPQTDCIAIDRLGEELTAAEGEHVQTCPRCQAELALFRSFESEAVSAEEGEAARAIAASSGSRPSTS